MVTLSLGSDDEQHKGQTGLSFQSLNITEPPNQPQLGYRLEVLVNQEIT